MIAQASMYRNLKWRDAVKTWIPSGKLLAWMPHMLDWHPQGAVVTVLLKTC